MEAIRRNTSTQVCAASGNGSGALATACAAASPGDVYALPSDPDDDPVLISDAPDLPAGLDLVAFQAVRYNAQGLARSPGATTPYAGRVVDLESDQLSSGSHRCIYMTTGTNLKTCSNDSDCDANTAPTSCQ